MMSQNNNIPQIRFKGFNDVWEQCKLEDITDYKVSSLSSDQVLESGKYKVYDANTMIGYVNDVHINSNYLTIIKDGSGVGRTRLLPQNTYFIGTMGGILAKNSDISFIFALLQNFDFSLFVNGATIPHVYYSDYSKQEIKVPNMIEQKLIGKIFDGLDNLITLHQRKHEKYTNLKKALLEKMFPQNGEKVPQIRFKGFTEAWEQCELWELTTWDKKFNEVEDIKQPKVIKYPYVLADVFKHIEDNNGNVVLLSTGTYVGHTTEDLAGKNLCNGEIVAIPWGGSPNVKYCNGKFVTADNRIATSNDKNKLDNKYLYYWLTSNLKYLETIYRGASIKHPSMSDVLNMIIKFPKLHEQQLISKELECLDNLITLHQRECEKLKNIKKSLLEKMFV